MSELSTGIDNIKQTVNAMKTRLSLPSTASLHDVLMALPLSGVLSTYLVENVSELNNIDATVNDLAFLYETTYVPAGNSSTFDGNYGYYMPKVVPAEYTWNMPRVFDGSVNNATFGTLTLKCNNDNVYKFTFSNAGDIWPGNTRVTVEYTFANGTFTRTAIYNTDTEASLSNPDSMIYINSGGQSNFTNWNDHVTQFQLVPIGKRVTTMYQYDGTTWNILPYGYTSVANGSSYFGEQNSMVSLGSTFVGKNGYEVGSLDNPKRFENMTISNLITDKSLSVLNLLQYFVNKTAYDGSFSYPTASTVGFPIKSDGTNLQPLPASLSSAFANNGHLYIIPKGVITLNTTGMFKTFYQCKRLCIIEHMDTDNVVTMNNCFYKNYGLEIVPAMNWRGATNLADCFKLCHVLTDDSLNNILSSCTTATKLSSSYKTLKYLGLTDWQADICVTLSNWSAAQAAGWTTGYEV